MDGTASVSPAAAVPVSMKMPEPITAPIPRAVRLQGPSDFASRLARLFRVRDENIDVLGAEQAHAFSASLWPLTDLLDLLLVRSAGFAGGARRNRQRPLARRALQLLAFCSYLQRVSYSFFSNPCKLFDNLLQPVSRETDCQLRVVAFAFPAKDRSATVLRMLHRGARAEGLLLRRRPATGLAAADGGLLLRSSRRCGCSPDAAAPMEPACRARQRNSRCSRPSCTSSRYTCSAWRSRVHTSARRTNRPDVRLLPAASAVLHQRPRNLAQEPRWDARLRLATTEAAAEPRPTQEQALFSPCHANVAQAALFFHLSFGIERSACAGKAPLPSRRGRLPETPGPWRYGVSAAIPARR